MKYTLLGNDQNALITYNKAHPSAKLDFMDLFILDWFINFTHAQKNGRCAMQTFVTGDKDGINQVFYRVKYEAVIAEFPFAEIGSVRAIADRFAKYTEGGLLEKKVFHIKNNRGGTATAFAIKGLYELQYSDESINNINNDTNIENNNDNDNNDNNETKPNTQSPTQSTIDTKQTSSQSDIETKQTSSALRRSSYYKDSLTIKDSHTSACVKKCFDEWNKIKLHDEYDDFNDFASIYQNAKQYFIDDMSDDEILTAIKNYKQVRALPNSWWGNKQTFENFCKNTIRRFYEKNFCLDDYIKKDFTPQRAGLIDLDKKIEMTKGLWIIDDNTTEEEARKIAEKQAKHVEEIKRKCAKFVV